MNKHLVIFTIILMLVLSCQLPVNKTNSTDNIGLGYDNGVLFFFVPSGDPNVEYGIRFPYYNVMNQYTGKKIVSASTYMRVVPTSVNVKIYACDFTPTFPNNTPDTEPNGGYPGFGDSILLVNQLYNSGNYTFAANSWNTFTLTNVVTIPTAKDIWVVIEITDNVNNAQICFDSSSGHYDSNYYKLTVGSGSWLNYLSLFNANMMIRAIIQ